MLKQALGSATSFAIIALVAGACVDHRPIRNGLRDESTYLDKAALTSPSGAHGDDGWLFKVTVVKASSPNVLGDYAFPGFESDLAYIKFKFGENKLQVVDGRQLQKDDPDNPNDDLATSTERVMLEFDGEHVDIKLRENLDGERTNLLEENFEEPWQRRQKFKVDWETNSLDPIANIAWFYADFSHECATLISQNLVPSTFEFDQAQQALNLVIEANYDLTVDGGCYDMVSLAHDVGTATIQYRLSFYRPQAGDYKAEEIKEKDTVNKKYGSFQVLNTFRDPETGLLSARSLLQRWNPDRTEPVTYYFHKGFPERFKPMFKEIEADTNKVMQEAGAQVRFRFAEYNEGGIERNLGDIRYSFVTWHQDIDSTRGLLGYGPSSPDPRTGEVISANVNLYNVGMDYYRFLIEDYLINNGAKGKPAGSENTPWEKISCTEGETVAPETETDRLQSGLFNEMRRVMELPEEPTADVRSLFIPEPARKDTFMDDYHRSLSEIRYVEPGYNSYVYRTNGGLSVDEYRKSLAMDRDYQQAMNGILMNENPLGAAPLYSRQGIENQLKFNEKMRVWRKNHDKLATHREILLGLNNIYTARDADVFSALSKGARRCKNGYFESDSDYRERIIEAVVFNVALHEFGHTLSLRHNFYGSVDAKHMEQGDMSSSIMDYVRSQYEASTPRNWGSYDRAALKWIYGGQDKREEIMKEDFLYCTDEHRSRSALCYAHDLGVTPSQIMLNAIEQYDFSYRYRNRRAYRTFWDTSSYVGAIYNDTFSPLRMWYLGLFDWAGGGVQDILKRLDQTDPSRTVLTSQQYDEIATDFYNDISAAIGMNIAFYDAIVNQAASTRNYQTEFDPYYGDVLRLGIIIDKLYATYAFMDLQDVYNYSPNVATYVAMYDAPFGDKNAALAQRVLDNMLGSNYDTFPWFRYTAVGLFASATNSNLVDTVALRDRIAIQRFENQMEFELRYGADTLAEADRPDNPAGLFSHKGEQYVHSFLPDQSWHLVASKSRSPVSYQFMKDYNEAVRGEASASEDTYGLKILLAYYEYFNNFVGF